MSLLVALVLAAATFQSTVPPQSAVPRGGAVFSGRVLEQGSGTPVAGATVTVIPFETAGGRARRVVTDDDGRYEIGGMAQGRYRVTARKDGFALMKHSQAIEVNLWPGEARDQVDILLQAEAIIVGRVLDPAGQPLASGLVLALRRELSPPAGTLDAHDGFVSAGGANIGERGAFRLAGLAPGEYYLRVVPRVSMLQRGGVTAATYFPGTANPAEAQPIVVAAGALPDEIVIPVAVVPVSQVFGIVTGRERQPLARAKVTLAMEQPTEDSSGATIPLAETRVDELGQFTFSNVAIGNYVLIVTNPDSTSQSSTPAIQTGDPAAQSNPDSGDLTHRAKLTVKQHTSANIRIYVPWPSGR